MIRKIVSINEELCNGCGACANACHEGAIAMINGKAKLIKDDYCDGLGDCLPACPTNAISIIEREASAYDEKAVELNLQKKKEQFHHQGCQGSMVKNFKRDTPCTSSESKFESMLSQWPVQIKLVPVNAPYFNNADLLISADCTAYAYANFHNDFIKNHITLIGCPKLDNSDYSEKLTEIIKNNNIKSIKVVRMEVPCCSGITNAVIQAIQNSGKDIPLDVAIITCDGNIKNI